MQTSHTHTHTPLSDSIIGRVINALVKPMDGKDNIHASKYRQMSLPLLELSSDVMLTNPHKRVSSQSIQ